MFETVPTYDKYRTLSLQTPNLHGEDVYALQVALDARLYAVGPLDGILGGQTDKAIRQIQVDLDLVADGKAGGLTQQAIAMAFAKKSSIDTAVPLEAVRGQLEHESGFRLGIYSPVRPDGTYDAGVAQRNTKFTPPKEGFDAKTSIAVLCRDVRKHFDLFRGVTPPNRRWALAQGAWNAPAFACYIARQEGAINIPVSMTLRPSSSARQTFEEYMSKVTKYLTA